MKELRVTADDGEWRFAFAFDPLRRAVVLYGADKRPENQSKFYESLIHVADRRYEQHLKQVGKEKKQIVADKDRKGNKHEKR